MAVGGGGHAPPLARGNVRGASNGRLHDPRHPQRRPLPIRQPGDRTRQGRVVVVQDAVDPETGQRYTVTRYRSEKAEDEDGWRRVRVVLAPDNAEYEAIVLTPEDEGTVAVVAELVEVLGDLGQ